MTQCMPHLPVLFYTLLTELRAKMLKFIVMHHINMQKSYLPRQMSVQETGALWTCPSVCQRTAAGLWGRSGGSSRAAGRVP